MIYDGVRWAEDKELKIERKAQDIPAMIRAEIPPGANPETVQAYSSFALRSEAKDRISAAIIMARSHVAVVPSELDRDPWLLNVLNGTIDLRTGELRRHDPLDMITKLAPVVYDPHATCPAFDQYMLEVMDGHAETVDYINRYMGYCLTGTTTEQNFPIHIGGGSNGKDLFIKIALKVMGSYSKTPDADLLRATKEGRHPANIYALRGVRFAPISETDKSVEVDEALLKRLTGTDDLSARGMFKDFVEFTREFKLVLFCNHAPKFKDRTDSLWRRVTKVPWPMQFVEPNDPRKPITATNKRKVKDKNLFEALKFEAPGILACWVQACRDWQSGGLRPPERVRKATEEYRLELDSVKEFVALNCEVEDGLQDSGGDLYLAYKGWMRAARPDDKPLSSRAFGENLGDLGHPGEKVGKVWRQGLRLLCRIPWDFEGFDVA